MFNNMLRHVPNGSRINIFQNNLLHVPLNIEYMQRMLVGVRKVLISECACCTISPFYFTRLGYSRKNPHPHDGRHAGKSHGRRG